MIEIPPREQALTARGRAAPLARLIDPFLLMFVGFAGLGDGLRIILTKGNEVGGVPAGGWIAALGAFLVVGSCIHVAKDIVRGYAENAPNTSDALFRPPAIAFAMLIIYIALINPLPWP